MERIVIIVSVIFAAGALVSSAMINPFISPISAHAQLQTIERRDVTIQLEGNRLQTAGELTIPAVGEGRFPAVLLIHGSGSTDRDEYLPPTVTGTGNESRPFWQIAEYLSERGFVVLRYDKRGIGENGTIIDLDTYANATVQQFQRDAEAALNFLIRQPEVDSHRITIVGHSEGAVIAPRIAADRPDDVQNIVLMSASAQSISDIVSYQLINRTILFAHQYWDDNSDGSLSIDEALAYEIPLIRPVMTHNNTANATTPDDMHPSSFEWLPGIDANGDNLIDIDAELLAIRMAALAEFAASPWFQSHEELEPTLDKLEELEETNILILQGEADIQTPLEGALLLEQRLTGLGHPDHTLLTYPGLGHTFYPAEPPMQPLGPVEDQVLSDLHSWLKEPTRYQQ